MGSKQNVIEINGRRYDAATGKPVKSNPDQVVKKVKQIQTGPASSSSRSKKPANSVHAKTKKSTTLNRSATTKPAAPKKVKTNAEVIKVRTAGPAKQALSSRVSEMRQQRASSNAKSASISKFALEQRAQEVQRAEEPEVEEDLVTKIAPQQSPKEALIAEQLAKANDTQERQSRQPVRDFFRRRPKLITVLATSAATLLVVGYVTYLNIPNMALRVAASRAGFEANMPAYRPNGFSFGGPIAYSPGQITIQFDSNTDDREFTITERETNWDSQSLLENYVKPETDLYSTFQERGLTVFIYEGSNAAWVNGGIWYTIEGDSLLNSEQLLKIATSL